MRILIYSFSIDAIMKLDISLFDMLDLQEFFYVT